MSRDGWILKGKAEPPFRQKRLEEAAPFVCCGRAGAPLGSTCALDPEVSF